MKVEKDHTGNWRLVSADGEVIEDGLSNRQAWRRYDILAGEHLNKKEQTADWSLTKSASGS